MMRNLILIKIILLGFAPFTYAWTEYRITTSPASQETPDIDGNIVCWCDDRTGTMGVYAANISDINHPTEFAISTTGSSSPHVGDNVVFYSKIEYDSSHPSTVYAAVYGYNVNTHTNIKITPSYAFYNAFSIGADESTVVLAFDYSLKGYDIKTNSLFDIGPYSGGDKFEPDVSGSMVVWRDHRNGHQDSHSYNADIYGFDMSKWQEMEITTKSEWQSNPAISGNLVVWQDYNNDIYGANISDPCNLVEFPICLNSAVQQNPAISGNIVVWQDNRNGNWDIYGYDISTQTEIQITTNTANQTSPAISGHTVVWQDERHGQSDIYATILYGSEVPRCTEKLQGDFNNDCKVDYEDFATVAQNWLGCNLDPPSACWE